MSAHNVIVVSADPKGHFFEGQMVAGAGAFKPGIHVMIDPEADLVDGRPQYKIWDGGADGERGWDGIVREMDLMGYLPTTEYAAGSRFLGYQPVNGDEVQMLLKNVGTGTGTGEEDVLIGDKFIVDKGTGKVIPTTGTPESEPWEAMESISDIEEDTLVLCRYTGK